MHTSVDLSTLLRAGRVRWEVTDGVGTVTLADPDRRNALAPATWRALAAIGAAVPDDVRVVVLRGQGPAFCAGLDLRMASPDGIPDEASLAELAAGSADDIDAELGRWQQAYTWLRDPRRVSVAAVHGAAVGAGFQLALACDLRVLADDARLCMRETALGLVPDMTATRPLVEAVGYSRALEICATARWIEAPEAVRIGLASIAVPVGELEAAAAELVAAVLGNDAAAVSAVKGLLLGAADRDPPAQHAAERRAQVPLLRALAARGAARPAGRGG